MIDSVLIANRGEIACRVIATAKAEGLRTIAVYSDADANARHVRLADEAHRLGPAPAAESYLKADLILEIAKKTGAQSIHPGYGFLSENADFSQACEDAGIVFVGPGANAIRAMGLKDKAKALMTEAGLENGFKARLHLPPTDYAQRSGLIIASDLKKIGIELEIISVDWGQWLKQVFKGKDFDLTIVSHTEPMDIGIYARDDYYFNYKDANFKALIKELNATSDETKRNELMQKAQEKLNADAVNGYLFQLAKTGVWNAKIKGLWANSPVQANDLTDVEWMD
ncbi:MAG TPA: hypothetical protein DCS30_13555 [Rhizobiales bacterium]|nr:hypothetical protein [Hyphomicrobiales bacterium]